MSFAHPGQSPLHAFRSASILTPDINSAVSNEPFLLWTLCTKVTFSEILVSRIPPSHTEKLPNYGTPKNTFSYTLLDPIDQLCDLKNPILFSSALFKVTVFRNINTTQFPHPNGPPTSQHTCKTCRYAFSDTCTRFCGPENHVLALRALSVLNISPTSRNLSIPLSPPLHHSRTPGQLS